MLLKLLFLFFIFNIYFYTTNARPEPEPASTFDEHDGYHIRPESVRHRRSVINNLLYHNADEENNADFWRTRAQVTVREHLYKRINKKRAKNVIMFLGDGMSIPTLGAARIYQGQLNGESGEQSHLFFENFPYTGLSQTYCVNAQVADSACSATAYLCGVKANEGTMGVTAAVKRKDCKAQSDPNNHVTSIAQWALDAGKAAGIVTTTRVTHASPGGTYAHTANRDWECDTDIIKDKQDPSICPDIATQLITSSPGKHYKVILGGGRREFLPMNVTDEEGSQGHRSDGINLIKTWQKEKQKAGLNAKYVWNRNQLLEATADSNLDSLLGLFESDHCLYNLDTNKETEPTLAEMTEAAITVLNKTSNGYFLFVEGGRIDHGHHETRAHKALDETVQLSDAIRKAVELIDLDDTLVVVTSDHAHTMSFAGYADRGGDILSLAGMGQDKLPYSTLSYANGPGYKPASHNGGRHNISEDNMSAKNYEFPAIAPLSSETHGGDDVGVFALGPWSHLFTGMYEQNVIPHLMAFASCLGDGLTYCDIRTGH
ncbi:membrane-bound alkaline phosphatase-like [Chrysoperla carnea]|uniref:membrane-bound alkaline phosphatase-like n=1 Tax=Chrysoperla carnea TaxID=189513 RepID=UPI001D06F01F|nr:membrane-bound alkaline phosphatase-like [Chrysoperla carnea]